MENIQVVLQLKIRETGLGKYNFRKNNIIQVPTWEYWPTPGRLAITGIAKALRASSGPIPDTMGNCGERNCSLIRAITLHVSVGTDQSRLTGPAARITSFLAESMYEAPAVTTCTLVAVFPSKRIGFARVIR